MRVLVPPSDRSYSASVDLKLAHPTYYQTYYEEYFFIIMPTPPCAIHNAADCAVCQENHVGTVVLYIIPRPGHLINYRFTFPLREGVIEGGNGSNGTTMLGAATWSVAAGEEVRIRVMDPTGTRDAINIVLEEATVLPTDGSAGV